MRLIFEHFQIAMKRVVRFCQLFCIAFFLAACAAISPITPTPTLITSSPVSTSNASNAITANTSLAMAEPTAEPTPEPTPQLPPPETTPSPTPNTYTVWLSLIKAQNIVLPSAEDLTLLVDASSLVLPADLLRSPEDWQGWPVIPELTSRAREIYQDGLEQGRDPHVFSIIGDCQSLPYIFMGPFDTDIKLVTSLSPDLQETVTQFSGSFSAPSPTAKSASTAGAILWPTWHEGAYGCSYTETPLDCELRRRNPSIMFINLGTHYETRNITYLRKILDRLIEMGVLPILSTKADNREGDGRLDYEMAQLAVEYGVPLWNFYGAVSDLPNHGVGIKYGLEAQGEIYLSTEGLARHRLTALEALDAVWRKVR